jgi:hypothetical protein
VVLTLKQLPKNSLGVVFSGLTLNCKEYIKSLKCG